MTPLYQTRIGDFDISVIETGFSHDADAMIVGWVYTTQQEANQSRATGIMWDTARILVNANVNALIAAHSPVIIYDVEPKGSPNTEFEWDEVMQGRLRHSAIHLPPYPYAWADEDSFYRSLFHELGHWTQDKVKRQQTIVAMENDLPDPSERDQVAAMFGAGLVGPRALEELVAELSAVLVARALHAGEMVERNAVYIASWLSHMKLAVGGMFLYNLWFWG